MPWPWLGPREGGFGWNPSTYACSGVISLFQGFAFPLFPTDPSLALGPNLTVLAPAHSRCLAHMFLEKSLLLAGSSISLLGSEGLCWCEPHPTSASPIQSLQLLSLRWCQQGGLGVCLSVHPPAPALAQGRGCEWP